MDTPPVSLIDEVLREPGLAGVRGPKLYALLKARAKVEPNMARRRAIEEHLANRRNFVEPIRSAPTLSTLNGVGSKLYGESERDSADGSFIATLYFVILYIPLFPIAQYLVRAEGGRRWTFFGKVPMDGAMRLWRRGFSLTALAAIVIGAIGIADHASHSEVYFVNALDIPVHIKIGKLDIKVGAGGREKKHLKTGAAHVKVVSEAGKTIDETDINVPGSTDVVAYNVLGAAPLYHLAISYFAHSSAKPPEDKTLPVMDAGRVFIVEDHVSYIFQEPPQEIQMSEGAVVEQRWRFDIIDGGWRSGVGSLLYEKKTKQALALAEAVALAESDDAATLENVWALALRNGGPDEGAAFARRLVERAPEDIDAHRRYQSVMITAGQRQKCIEEYRARAAKSPDSAMWQYLLARVLPHDEAIAKYQTLVQRFPDDVYVHRSFAYELAQKRRFAESVAEWNKLVALRKTPDASEVARQVEALLGLGHADEAVRVLAAFNDANPGSMLGTLYMTTALQARGKLPHPVDFYSTEDPLARLWYAMARGRPLDPALLDAAYKDKPEPREGFLIYAQARTDLEGALARLKKAKPEARESLSDPLSLALACELERRGDHELAEALLDTLTSLDGSLPALKAYVLHGEKSPEVDAIDLSMQAALELARARGSKDPAERRRLLAQAKSDDVLHGAVFAAADHWQ